MAITRANSGLDVVLDAGRTYFEQKRAQMALARTRRKLYRATCHELSALTDRDLKDLGISRSSIKAIALEAANGL